MFSKIKSIIAWLFKNKDNIANAGSDVLSAGSDIAQLVSLVAAKNYVGAATFLLSSIQNLKNVNVDDIVSEARKQNVDLNDFIPLLNHLNTQTRISSQNIMPTSGLLSVKSYDAKTLISKVLARRTENKTI